MYAFVFTRFYVAPRKGMLAVFVGVFGPPLLRPNASKLTWPKSYSPMVFDVAGRNILGYWQWRTQDFQKGGGGHTLKQALRMLGITEFVWSEENC